MLCIACGKEALQRKKFRDPSVARGDDDEYITHYFCSELCEEAIIEYYVDKGGGDGHDTRPAYR